METYTTQKNMTLAENEEYWRKQVGFWDNLRYIVKNWDKYKKA